MSDSLALRYRPRTFRDMVGQRPVQTVLHYALHVPRQGGDVPKEPPTVPHGLLFHGTRGAGKTSSARILAAGLNCAHRGERPCTSCDSCMAVATGTSPAVVEVDAASSGLVADIRALTDLVAYDCGMPYRVVVLDECHAMSREGFQALLKTLEEPPARTVFVLVTTERAKVPDTVASRCVPFLFRRIPPALIAKRLAYVAEREGFTVDPALLAELAERADGGMRDALMALDQALGAGISTLAQFQVLHGESDFAPVLVHAMVMGDHAALFTALDHTLASVGDPQEVVSGLVRCLRDVLVLHAGGTLTAAGAPLARRQALARLVAVPAAGAALRALWGSREHTRGLTPRAALELTAVMCSEALRPAYAAVPAANGNGSSNGHSPLTPERIREMAVAAGTVR